MLSNKIPVNGVAFLSAYNSIAFINSHRIPGFFLINRLKLKAWIRWILFKKAVGFECLFLHIRR